ncbi:hypothetical protein GCM10027589_31310 [Actinocorallia lasiicapitis]
MIGTQPITVTVSTVLPDFQTGGTYSLPITAVTDVTAETSKGMWAAKAYTIEGTGVANAKLFSPEFPTGKEVKTNIDIAKKAITTPGLAVNEGGQGNAAFPPPEPTAGVSLNATGNSENITLTQGGWAQINVENLKLKLTPKDEAGNPTSLGTFDADCWVQAGQHNVLGQSYINGGGTPGNPPATFDTQPPRGQDTKDGSGLPTKRYELAAPLKFSCLFPAIQRRTVMVDMAVDFPEEIDTNTRARPIVIDVITHIDDSVSTAIAGVYAKYLGGIAISNNVITNPDDPATPLHSQTRATLDEAVVPDPIDEEGNTPGFKIYGKAIAPALVFQKAGDGAITIGDPSLTPVRDLVLSMDTFDADHVRLQPPLGQFRRNCYLLPDSLGKNLLTFKVKQAAEPAPGAISGLDGTTTHNSANLTWNAPTTGGPATSYVVSWPGGTKTVTSTNAEITGLNADTDYAFTVIAKGAGGDSAPVSKTLRTKPEPLQKPGAVGSVDGTTTHNSATVTWTAPATGGAVANYKVSLGGVTKTVPAGTLTETFTGLTADTDYTASVVASNAAGDSAPVTKVLRTKPEPLQKPGAVGSVDGSTTHNSATVTWTAPTTGGAVASYKVSLGGQTKTVPAAGPLTANFTGLTADTDYTASVVASNAAGDSAAVTKVLRTKPEPLQAPGAVGSVDGTTTSDSATVTWTAPATGGAVANYKVTLGGQTKTVPATTLTATFTGLTADTDYTASVVASNAAGDSAAVTKLLRTQKPPLQKPGAVGSVDGTTTSDSATVTWTAPATGGAVESYKVSLGGQNKTVPAGTLTATFTGLTADTDYTASVVASNAAGDSAAVTKLLRTQKPPLQKPGAVGSVDGTTTSDSATATWTAPTTGGAVESYTVTLGGQTKTVPAAGPLTATFNGLTADTDYTASVVAVNAAGSSAPVTKVLRTKPVPLEKPGAVGSVDGTTTSDSATVTWTAPATGGAVASYKVSLGGQNKTVPAGTLTATFTGLTADTDYTASVVASNAAGDSAPVTKVLRTKLPPLQKPGAVGSVDGTTTINSATVKWTAPTTGGAVESYTVTKDGAATSVPVGTLEKTYEGLAANTNYEFCVSAVNAAGASAPVCKTLKTQPIPVVVLAAPVITVDSADSFAPTLSWGAVDRATGYEVYRDGVKVGSPTGTIFKSADLAYGKGYKFTVKAVNAVPAETSPASNEITVTPKDTTKPTAPVLTAGTASSNSVPLTWTASTDSQAGVAGYDVFKDGVKVNATLITATDLTVTGLEADKDYVFTVQAVDKAGNVSDLSNAANVHTLPIGQGTEFAYNVAGSSKIKAANGTLPLKGKIAGTITGGNFAGDLALEKSTGSFRLLGFIPATADATFVQQGQTTGTLSGTNLTTNSKMLVKIPSVKVFGIEVAGGPACQTKTPVDVTLKSTNFVTGVGGALSGTYTIPATEGCGSLNSQVTALLAGPGNTINVTLKK